MEEIYCRECGSQLVEHFTGKYDPFNGSKIKSKHCPNLQCENGCEFAGHIFPFFSNKCVRCGYENINCF